MVQDVGEGEEDDDEEEEEEEDGGGDSMQGQQQHGQKLADTTAHKLRPSTPIHSARTSPTSSAAPRTPQETPKMTPSLYTTSPSPLSAGGKVRVIRQWTPRTEMWAGTVQV